MTIRSLLWGCIPYGAYFCQLVSICDVHSKVLSAYKNDFEKITENHRARVAGAISDQLLIEHEDKKLLKVFERYAYRVKTNEPADLDKEWIAAMLERVHTLSTEATTLKEQNTQLKATVSEERTARTDSEAECRALKKKVAAVESKATAAEREVAKLNDKLAKEDEMILNLKGRVAALQAKYDAIVTERNTSFDNSAAEIDEARKKVIVAESEVVVLSSKLVEVEAKLRRRIERLKQKSGENDADDSSDGDEANTMKVKLEPSATCDDGGDQNSSSNGWKGPQRGLNVKEEPNTTEVVQNRIEALS